MFLKSDWYRNHIQLEERQSQKHLKGNNNINGKGLPFLLIYLTLKVVNEETNSHWFIDLLSVKMFQDLE